MIEANIKQNWIEVNYHESRVKYIWTNEVNDLLEVNLEGLKRIAGQYWNIKGAFKKKWLEPKETESLITKIRDLVINVKTIRKCYYISKMTCIDEQ